MSLEQILQHYRAELVSQAATTEHVIQAAHNHMLAAVHPHVSALLKEYKAAQSGEQPVPLHWLYTGNRLQSVKHAVSQNVSQFGTQAKAQVLTLQHKGALLGEASAISQLKAATPNKGIQTVEKAPFDKLVAQQAKPIGALMGDYGVDAADRCGQVLVTSVTLGRQPDAIDKLIMAILLMSLYRSITVLRTSEMIAYRSSVLLTFQVNDDIARLWEWKALGPHPCPFCLSMDGTRHDISEDMVSHPNCYCVQQLIAKGA